MALQGTIDSFPVVDVLGMLSSSSKTGCLELVGDRGRSRVWVHDGRIVGGEVEQHPTSDAADVVFEFLLNESGSFEFVTDASAPEENLDSGIEEAVAEAERMVQEWSEVREVVPDTSMVVTLVADPGVEEVVLDRSEWEMVTAAVSSPVVEELLEAVGLGEFVGCRRLAGLIGRGLATLGPPRHTGRGDAALAPDEVVVPAVSGHDAELHSGEAQHSDPPVRHLEESVAPEDDGGVGWRVEPDHESVESPRETATTEPVAGGFPEHFPIDDLVGTEEAVSFDGIAGSAASAEAPPDAFTGAPDAGPARPQPFTEPGAVPPTDQPVAAFGEPVVAGTHAPGPEAAPTEGDQRGGDDVLSQIGKLSPKAAEAIAAALGDGENG